VKNSAEPDLLSISKSKDRIWALYNIYIFL